MPKTFKRRNYFIDKVAQGRFIGAFALASVLGGAVAVFCFRYLAQKKIDATLYSMRLPDIPLVDLLMKEMVLTSLVTALFVILLFALAGGRLFKRIGGPLKKISGSLQNIINGDLCSEVKLREGDDFQDFAGEVNGVVLHMNSRLSKIRLQAEKIAELSRSAEQGQDLSVELIQAPIAVIQEELRGFKL